MNQRPLWGSVVLYFFAALIVVISVYPFLYTVATSLKSGTELFSTSSVALIASGQYEVTMPASAYWSSRAAPARIASKALYRTN